MVLKLRNIVTVFMLAGIIVPFVFITDFFPFLRFGMFAEPIQSNKQTERFIVYSTDTTNIKKVFDPISIGINNNTFHYLLRNYYYRKESILFLSKISAMTPRKPFKLEIAKIITDQNLVHNDTIIVNELKP